MVKYPYFFTFLLHTYTDACSLEILSIITTELLDFISRFRFIITHMTQIEIPSELPSILRNFTLSILRTKPPNIIDYAVDYFTQLQQQHQQSQLMIGDNIITTVPLSSISHYEQQQEQQQQTSKPNVIPSGQAEDVFLSFLLPLKHVDQ